MQQQEITVRRARPSDAAKIAAFVNNAWRGQQKIDDMAVIERFGNVGFLLAERGGELVGMLGWMAENLVVGLTDLLIGAASDRIAVSQVLLDAMEQAADELQCEAVLVFLPRPTPPALIEFCKEIGYQPEVVSSLSAMWQETARGGGLADNDTVMVKRLREGLVFRPFNM
jgi:N-acetylglutamate synthase-like GNAT family acetyltransferase